MGARRIRSVLGAVAVVAASVGLWSTSASAHVTITTYGPVAQGSFSKIGFSVPNERDDAGTVALRVQLPEDHPLAYVSVQPMPGWDVATTTRALDAPLDGEGGSIDEVVDTITWTATGDTQIAPGEFELFWISAGQLPTDVDELVFPAIQTYSSGEEVAWIETGEDAELPAPTVALTAVDGASGDTAATTVPPATASSSDDGGSDALGIVALVVAGAALVVAVVGVAASRRRPAST
jgi:uncharacterized protein YcnI